MKTISIVPESKNKRSCDGCVACCEGWLEADIYGYKMYPGRKCQFVSEKNCSIYPNRPKDPCQDFKCVWLTNSEIPHWIKPSLSNVILTLKKVKEIEYIQMKEAGSKVDSNILNWFMQYALSKNLNARYEVNGGWNYIGSSEFILEISK